MREPCQLGYGLIAGDLVRGNLFLDVAYEVCLIGVDGLRGVRRNVNKRITHVRLGDIELIHGSITSTT